MQALAILLIGYSLFSALTVAVTHFCREDYRGQPLARAMGLALLLALASLQWMHFLYLQYASMVIHGAWYRLSLFTVAPTFYLFSQPILHGYAEYRPLWLMHFLPVAVAGFLPHTLALPLAFLVGAAYLPRLGWDVYALRGQRDRFRLELSLLGVVFGVAVVVALLGLGLPSVAEALFVALYASAIGAAFLLVSVVLNLAPRLPAEVAEAARETYATTTLGKVDCDAALENLKRLMETERLYRRTDLDLPMLAGELGLSSHQLSELINTRLGKGFSRFIREYRIAAAESLLLAEPAASVLSVGMSVGYGSQSAFYDAFREITGMTPGRYRKLHRQSSASR